MKNIILIVKTDYYFYEIDNQYNLLIILVKAIGSQLSYNYISQMFCCVESERMKDTFYIFNENKTY